MSGPPPERRLAGIDALKGLACVLIIWHHLAFYGPMSDTLYPHAPGLTDWLYDRGRMAVQVFLVVGGFLAAVSLAPAGAALSGQAGRLVLRRYRRLVTPYLVALLASVLVAALVRPWFDHPSVPAEPTLWQVLAHALLLHDLLSEEALSAGVWYVAIDFQLFALSVLIFSLSRRLGTPGPGRFSGPALAGVAGMAGVLLLGALSLFFFNLDADLDMTGLYFFGAYALGMLAFWTCRADRPGAWLLGLAALGGLALLLDFRERLAVALAVALGLALLQQQRGRVPPPGRWLRRYALGPLEALGQRSYSIFLIHFPVCLLVNALVHRFWPAQVQASAAGLLAAFALSLLAGWALYRGVEARHGAGPGMAHQRPERG